MENKFRVFNKKTNQYDEREFFISNDGVLFVYELGKLDIVGDEDYIVEWSIGKKDRRGIPIYQNDVVSGMAGALPFKMSITWSDKLCCFHIPAFKSDCDSTHWYEVISTTNE